MTTAPATTTAPITSDVSSPEKNYIANTSSKKFHEEGCSGLANANPDNLDPYFTTRENMIGAGFTPCGICKP